MSSEEKKKLMKVAKKLVSVTAGKNSFIGEFTGEWDGGTIILRDAVAHGTKQMMMEVPDPLNIGHSKTVPVQVPAPGLLPWLVNEPVAQLEIRPDHLFRLKDQSDDTQEAAAGMYVTFLEYLRDARQGEGLVQQAGPDEMAKLQAAGMDPNSLFSQFGPVGNR